MFASLSIFLHSSHVKLALKISASTSMCSNAGFMLAFCPRRLFNILLFFVFLCRKQQLLLQKQKDFFFFACMHETKKGQFGHHKITKSEWMRKNDVHLFFEQRLSVTSEISFDDTIFHEQNAVVFRGGLFLVGVVFNRHHAFVERTKFRIQSRANESRN